MEKAKRQLWLDQLRAFLTVLVLAHHASLAYTTFASFNSARYISSTAPVVDPSRWIGMDIFENFNDIFFMSLMFMVSGFFVYNGLKKKGRKSFVIDRLKRLGFPFIIGVCLIIPLAHTPSYILANGNSSGFQLSTFISDFLNNQQWPVGPPWFLWVLLLFNIIAIAIPNRFYTAVFRCFAHLASRPLLLFSWFYYLAAIAFIPLSLWVGQYTWTGWGPFDFQLSRILLYALFFGLGICLGSGDWTNHIFLGKLLLRKTPFFWIILALLTYAIIEALSFYGTPISNALHIDTHTGLFIFDLVFVLSCISSSLAFLSLFRAYCNKTTPILISLADNAYGIYLLHYPFITWLQYLLLKTALPVPLKFSIVFLGSLAGSWGITLILRKVKLIRTII